MHHGMAALEAFELKSLNVALHNDFRYSEMPLSNIQLLVRSQPGGLGDHRKFLTEHVNSLIESNRFVDLVIFSSEDGEAVHFNQSLLGKG